MKLTYKFKILQNQDLSDLCKISNNLYNQANYIIKKELNENYRWIRYNELNKILRKTKNLDDEINYKLLKVQTSQQLLRLLDKNWSSYFKSIKVYKKNQSKFNGMPRAPRFRKKTFENILIYTNQCSQIKEGFLILSKSLKLYIPQYEKYKDRLKNYKQIRILPRNKFYEVEIVYEYECKNEELNYKKYGSIDFGINNLITLVTDKKSLLYNGRICKSVNQYYNKTSSKLKSIRDYKSKSKERRTWNNEKIRAFLNYRNNFLNDHFHKVSRHLVNYLVENKIGNLVVGINRGWKDSITIGKRSNQNFLLLPHSKLLNFIKYKCQMVGIKVEETEENYTSKCDGLILEKICKHKDYSGKRKKRGLFQSEVGKLLNADVNGALNILRKVLGDVDYVRQLINSGFLFNPVKVRIT